VRYVERKGGLIVAHYSHPTEFAAECVPDDHPDLVAYAERRKHAVAVDRERYGVVRLEARVTALEAEIAKLRGGA
jgi:hypothetical protein